jgi:hypothetical protein
MLLEFQVENFRSFKGRQTFSMVAGSFPDHLNENTFDPGIDGVSRVVRSAVVYGANAAGKTNLLRAIQFVQSLVVNSASTALSDYPFSPFKLSAASRKAPSRFEITFVHGEARYEYGFTMGPSKIEDEWLIEYSRARVRTKGRRIFRREWNESENKYDWDDGKHLKGQRAVWRESTRPEALFLSTAVQLNSVQLRPVFEWFLKKLVVVVDNVSLNETLTIKIFDEPGGKERLIPFLKEADLGIADFNIERKQLPSRGMIVQSSPAMIVQQGGGRQPDVVSVMLSHRAEGKEIMELDFNEESSGTQILFRTAGAWLNAIANSEVLLVDEVDRSLHPSLSSFLIRKFHSSKTNPQNAQLICTTHNTSFMDQILFRRDQIWFAEKDRHGASRLYPLTDFKPRNDEVLERWYKRGRYGALPLLPESD